MNDRLPKLAFVSPIFLFPANTGGRIRTSNILRGLKGGRFEVTLLSPATAEEEREHAADLAAICDRFVGWRAPRPPRWRRALHLLGRLPVNVAADASQAGRAAVAAAAAEAPDLMVFDFVHAAVLMPEDLASASLCFTHNVEAEIFARHATSAANPLMRLVWHSQHRKMVDFEARSLRRFTSVVAVSERDAAHFGKHYGIERADPIPTGVDLEYFAWNPPTANDPAHPPTIVFTGSMDSAANYGGVEYFIDSVWPRVLASRPQARLIVVGRNPPAWLVASGGRHAGVEFTGSVPDVRPYVARAHVFVIPLLVGGGTRIKAFEAMAAGCPVVSTTLGIEGLEVESGRHYLRGDDAEEMAAAILRLLDDPSERERLSKTARALVEARFGHAVAAAAFENLCMAAVRAAGTKP